MTAVASVPAKAIGGVTDMLHMGGDKKQQEPTVVRLPFKSGDVTLSADSTQQIDQIVHRMRKNQNVHVTLRGETSADDASVAYERANPPPADCRAGGQASCPAGRDGVPAPGTLRDGDGQLASADPSAKRTLEELAALDGDISKADEAIDYLYDMLRPGASNQASRRAAQ